LPSGVVALMRLLTAAIALVLVLSAPSAANAKAGGLRFCGLDACRTVFDDGVVTAIIPVMSGRNRPGVRPPVLSPFYSVRWSYADGQTAGWPAVYYAPSAGLVRVDEMVVGKWIAIRDAGVAFERATRGISPFPTPRVTRVDVGNRRAREPASYVQLYEHLAQGSRVRDPVGRRPALEWSNYKALVRYYVRDRRFWIRIRLTTASPSPWSDETTQLAVGRRHDLLRGDGTVVRVPRPLAQRIRKGGR
jgi:hypothetical protein